MTLKIARMVKGQIIPTKLYGVISWAVTHYDNGTIAHIITARGMIRYKIKNLTYIAEI